MDENEGDDNVYAGKLEAMWFLVFRAGSDEELEEAKAKAARIAEMTEEEVRQLLESQRDTPDGAPEGDLVQNMRD